MGSSSQKIRQITVLAPGQSLRCSEPGCPYPAAYQVTYQDGRSIAVCQEHMLTTLQ